MCDQLRDLSDPIHSDSLLLFHRQRMVCGFQFDERSFSNRLGVDYGLQIRSEELV